MSQQLKNFFDIIFFFKGALSTTSLTEYKEIGMRGEDLRLRLRGDLRSNQIYNFRMYKNSMNIHFNKALNATKEKYN